MYIHLGKSDFLSLKHCYLALSMALGCPTSYGLVFFFCMIIVACHHFVMQIVPYVMLLAVSISFLLNNLTTRKYKHIKCRVMSCRTCGSHMYQTRYLYFQYTFWNLLCVGVMSYHARVERVCSCNIV